MLDYSRRPVRGRATVVQRRGPFPDVRRALATYWAVEHERQGGCSYHEAWRRVSQRRPVRSAGAVRYQWERGREYDRELSAAWGRLYPLLRDETLAQFRPA